MRRGFISDAHGHVEAFLRGLEVLRDEGASDVHFLGDAIGYLPGFGVLEMLRDQGIPALLGNHEAMALAGPVPPDRDRVYRLNGVLAGMPVALRRYLEGLPSRRRLDGAQGPLLLVHGSPREPLTGYVHADADLAGLETDGCRWVFMGHTHRPFIRRRGDATFVNVGSCGLPRDHGALGSVALFDDEAGQARILRFPIAEETRRALARCGPPAPEVEAVFGRRSAAFGEVVAS